MLTDKEVKEICQKQAERAYEQFLWFVKWFSIYSVFLLLFLAIVFI